MTMTPIPTAPDPSRLLVLRALKLGDLLVAVPALRGLRRGFPHHRLVLATPAWLSPIVRLIDAVDELLPTAGLDASLPYLPGEIDIAVNLHGNGMQSRAMIDALDARLTIAHRVPGYPDGVPWVDGLHERERWVRLVSAFGIQAHADDLRIARPAVEPLVRGAAIVHVGAAFGSRYWPVERFAAVAAALVAAGKTVVLTGGAADAERAHRAAALAGITADRVLAGRAGLAEFAALIAHAAVLVSVDTGAAHLASSYGVPSVIVFGPSPPEQWGPPEGPHIVLTDPRLRRGDPFADDPDPALLAVTADEVIAALRSMCPSPGLQPGAQGQQRAAQQS